MKSNHDFSDAKFGDLVTSLLYGNGIIQKTEAITEHDPYTIGVFFEKTNKIHWYTSTGRRYASDVAPTLFKGHIDINSLQVTYNTLPDAT